MSILTKVARATLPATSRRSIRRYANLASYLTCWPSKSPLSRELVGLELSKSEKPLKALRSFPELTWSAWSGLELLTYQMVLRYRPKVIVELGTHMGLSALAMGLALRELGEGGQLFAIDCWEGDPQAGRYGGEVYETFMKRREELKLESTIVPLKMFFEQAKDKVATPIDLLHIDGLHTWDAVKSDWETFGPLVRPGGLVMFHDVRSRFSDLRKFWAEMSSTHESHTVPYANGLGIIRTKV